MTKLHILRLPEFNQDGFKDALSNWNDLVAAAKSHSGVYEMIQQRKLAPLVVQLCQEQLISLDQGINMLKDLFHHSIVEQEDIVYHISVLIAHQLEISPAMPGEPLVGSPYFRSDSPADLLSKLLREREDLAEGVIRYFFEHQEER